MALSTRNRRVRPRLPAATALAALAGCHPVRVHPPDVGAAEPAAVEQAEAAWSRHARPAEGLELHATLWDAELVASTVAADPSGPGAPAWTRRYLERATFTVVVELEDRHPTLDFTEMLRADGWSFALLLDRTASGAPSPVLVPTEVDLLLVDRFGTSAGAHHYRLSMVVRFEDSLHELTQGCSSVGLQIRPAVASADSERRSMLGSTWTQRGSILRWTLAQR